MGIGFRNAGMHNFGIQLNRKYGKRENSSSETKNLLNNTNNESSVRLNSKNLLSEWRETLKDERSGFSYYSERYDIPNGHSKYEYKDAVFDIYRQDEDYQSQFVHPDNFDKNDFYKEFPHLKPIANRIKVSDGSSSSSSVNGLIDENTIQGSTGDCWLISSLYSMSSTEKGKEIIKNSIKVNEDSSITVTFGGIGVSYTITESELSRHDTDRYEYDAYSNGDNDVLVMELAVEKLWKDIKKGKVTLDTDNENLLYTGEGFGISDGGLPNQLVYYLTGIDSKEYYNDDLSDLSENKIYEILENAYKSGDTALSFGVYNDVHTSTLIDGSTYELDLGNGGHALAITDVQKDTVTFVNPWDTSTKYTMTWEQFANLGIGYICSSDMSSASIKDEITDMSGNSGHSSDYSYDYSYDGYYKYDDYSNYNYDYSYYNDRYSDDSNDYNYSGYGGYSSAVLSYLMDLLESILDLLKVFAR